MEYLIEVLEELLKDMQELNQTFKEDEDADSY